jgi:DNA-binding response OmpR family regulator
MDKCMTQSVLILDKDEALCDELAEILRGTGYQASSGLDGQEGKRLLLKDREYDLVLLGLELPEDEESDLLGAIRGRSLLTKVLLLIRAHSARASGRALTDGFLSKPLIIPALLEKVGELIGQGPRGGHVDKGRVPPTGINLRNRERKKVLPVH